MSDSLRAHGLATHQAFLSFTISRSLLKLRSIELVMLSNHLILCLPLLLLSSIFPSFRDFISLLALCSRWPEYWSFCFSINPSNEYSGLISFLSKGLSRVFSSTTLQKHHSSMLSLIYGPTFTSVHDY